MAYFKSCSMALERVGASLSAVIAYEIQFQAADLVMNPVFDESISLLGHREGGGLHQLRFITRSYRPSDLKVTSTIAPLVCRKTHFLTPDEADRLAELRADSLRAIYYLQPLMPRGDQRTDIVTIGGPEPDMYQRPDDPEPDEDGLAYLIRLDPTIVADLTMQPIPRANVLRK